MAKLAIRVTSDRTKREHVITGNEGISIDFLVGNKFISWVQIQDEGTHYSIDTGDGKHYHQHLENIEKER